MIFLMSMGIKYPKAMDRYQTNFFIEKLKILWNHQYELAKA